MCKTKYADIITKAWLSLENYVDKIYTYATWTTID